MRNLDFSSEAFESTQAIRERTQSETRGQIECATADGPVTAPCIEDEVTVEQARWDTPRLGVVDPRTGQDLRKVGGLNRAMATGLTRVFTTILRHMEVSASPVRAQHRGHSPPQGKSKDHKARKHHELSPRGDDCG